MIKFDTIVGDGGNEGFCGCEGGDFLLGSGGSEACDEAVFDR